MKVSSRRIGVGEIGEAFLTTVAREGDVVGAVQGAEPEVARDGDIDGAAQ